MENERTLRKQATLSRRKALMGLATAGLGLPTAVLVGCGGNGSTVAQGGATLQITWPDATRLVPVAANSIKIAFLSGSTVVASQTVTRPSTGNTSTVSFTTLPATILTLKAEAFSSTDGSGVPLAAASKSVTLVEGVETPLEITMASTISALSVTPTGPSVVVGSTVQLAVSGLNASSQIVLVTASTVTWTSLTPSLASVSSTGLVTGLAEGTAQIQVSESESGKTTTVSVSVTPTSASCHLIPTETDGPYPLYTVLSNSAMIRSSITESKAGVPLTIELTLVKANGGCAVVPNAYVYIWHCDKEGQYSGYSSSQNGSHSGETYCRGIQKSDSSGKVTFTTVYPGWYAGRITHVHFQVYLTTLSGTATATSQFAFPQEITYAVYNSSLYSTHGQNSSVTSFAQDNVFSDGTQYQMATLTGSVESGYVAKLTVGINT